MTIIYWALNLCLLVAVVLLIRKMFQSLAGNTHKDRIELEAAEEAARHLGLENASAILVSRLRYEHRPVHVADVTKSFRIREFSAPPAVFQAVGDSMFFICTFLRVNPFDSSPLYLHSSLLDDIRYVKSGQEEFFHNVSEMEYQKLERFGVDFSHAYIVKVTRVTRDNLTAELYLSSSAIRPVPEIVRGRQKCRSYVSRIFF